MYQVLAFIKYWLLQVDDHSLHSPFVFNFYQQVIKKASDGIDPEIENLRGELVQNRFEFELKEYGAGSRVHNCNKRKVSEVVKNSSTPPRFSALLASLIRHFNFKNIVELGTSVGLNTLYLSQQTDAQVLTLEGDPTLINLAEENFNKLGRNNINMVSGNIDDSLASAINELEDIDLAYIDANHRYEPTIKYYEALFSKCHYKSLIVLDDIHWSKEMNQAWEELKNRPEVSISIDLFEGGLLFFDPKLTGGDYIIYF